jgi:uncharacterized protein with PIN domain
MPKQANFRFYEELNDFLPSSRRKLDFTYYFEGNPSVKDAIEAMGVPHTEVDLILVNGHSVPFSHSLRHGDRVSVYPTFEQVNIAGTTRLRPDGLRHVAFILDVHLGKLAKYLRMLGFDTVYEKDYDDPEIVRRGIEEKRIVLTRDIGILKHRDLTHGYWVRSQDPMGQLKEVIDKFDLSGNIREFRRCMACNGMIRKITKTEVENKLKPKTRRYYKDFFQCIDCGKIYWQGSHYENMKSFISEIRKNNHPGKK